MDPLPRTWSAIQASEPEAGPPAPAPSTYRLIAPSAAVGVALVGALILVVGILAAPKPPSGLVALPSGDTADSDSIVVEVDGAVRHPGLVTIPPGSRVADAIAAAGGYSAAVDATAVGRTLHLAEPVDDGDQVTVPRRGDVVPAGDAEGPPGDAGPIDVNTASESQLDTLPGIGPVTAAKIVTARTEQPFASVDDLLTRKVVGAATLAKIRDLIVVR
ncbi:MAG TPA: ComEA family DNA-binding protein [Candidatus Limnocylindrales bacterium]